LSDRVPTPSGGARKCRDANQRRPPSARVSELTLCDPGATLLDLHWPRELGRCRRSRCSLGGLGRSALRIPNPDGALAHCRRSRCPEAIQQEGRTAVGVSPISRLRKGATRPRYPPPESTETGPAGFRCPVRGASYFTMSL
jgi:hypothetical protein